MFSVPESPAHLARKGKTNALSASAFYHGRSFAFFGIQPFDTIASCWMLTNPPRNGALEMLQLQTGDQRHHQMGEIHPEVGAFIIFQLIQKNSFIITFQQNHHDHDQAKWDSYSRRMLIIVSILAIATRMSGFCHLINTRWWFDWSLFSICLYTCFTYSGIPVLIF